MANTAYNVSVFISIISVTPKVIINTLGEFLNTFGLISFSPKQITEMSRLGKCVILPRHYRCFSLTLESA